MPNCPKCHSPLPEDAPQGLCPTCLMAGAPDSLANLSSGSETIPDSGGDARLTPRANPSHAASFEQPGTRLGPYKLLQKLGEGGFGIVFLAEQREPIVRRVALKIIKAGMDTRQVIARFEAERQALALMDHPNIAKVLDAGATGTGRPYFAMELVRGEPVTSFCDKRKYDTRQRLELFMDICAAVQHAHQKGVIHRDLKPSNILVGLDADKPVAKVIDFGIAKATQQQLTDKTLFTRFEQFIGTPVYISPEQAELSAVDIDTRSDIYSLGVILYELLTGKPPLDAKKLLAAGLDEVRRMIRETEAPKPSTRLSTAEDEEIWTIAQARHTEPKKLGLLIRGDLDWIVLKALAKERARRYETANALREDLGRFLRDEPVLASPPGAQYRLRKFVRRHRGPVTAAALLLVSLVLGITGTTWGLLRALDTQRDLDAALQNETTERERAEAARQREKTERERAENARTAAVNARREQQLEARRATGTLEFIRSVFATGPSLVDPEATRYMRSFLDDAANRVLEIDKNDKVQGAMVRITLAEAYDAIGDVNKAQRLAAEAYAILHRQPATTPPALARAARLRAEMEYNPDWAAPQPATTRILELALNEFEAQGQQDTPEALACLSSLGMSQARDGDLAEAAATLEKALQTQRSAPGSAHPDTLATRHRLGVVYTQLGKFDEAETVLREALEVRRMSPPDANLEMLQTQIALAAAQGAQGREDKNPEAARTFKQAIAQGREFFEATHPLGAEHPLIAMWTTAYGRFLRDSGKWKEAEAQLHASHELQKRILDREGAQGQGYRLATAHEDLADLYLAMGNTPRARKHLEDGIRLSEQPGDPNHSPPGWERLARMKRKLAALLADDRSEALRLLEEAFRLCTSETPRRSPAHELRETAEAYAALLEEAERAPEAQRVRHQSRRVAFAANPEELIAQDFELLGHTQPGGAETARRDLDLLLRHLSWASGQVDLGAHTRKLAAHFLAGPAAPLAWETLPWSDEHHTTLKLAAVLLLARNWDAYRQLCRAGAARLDAMTPEERTNLALVCGIAPPECELDPSLRRSARREMEALLDRDESGARATAVLALLAFREGDSAALDAALAGLAPPPHRGASGRPPRRPPGPDRHPSPGPGDGPPDPLRDPDHGPPGRPGPLPAGPGRDAVRSGAHPDPMTMIMVNSLRALSLRDTRSLAAEPSIETARNRFVLESIEAEASPRLWHTAVLAEQLLREAEQAIHPR